jgi:hypothetical protein
MAIQKAKARKHLDVATPRPADIALSMKLSQKVAFQKALLKQYSETLENSMKAGKPYSFRVNVDPAARAQTITIEKKALSLEEALPVEEAGKPDAKLRAALTLAHERGRRRAAEILAGDDMLTAEAFAELLGVSRVTVNAKRQSGQVLGLDGAKRGFRFPIWQLDKDCLPFAVLSALYEQLGNSAWAVYRFLVSPQGALNGRTGLEAVERGRTDEVIAAAKSISRGDFR